MAEFLLDARFQLEVERRAGNEHPAKSSAFELSETVDGFEFQQPLVGRRHPEQVRDALFCDRFRERRRIVFRHDMGGRARHQSGDQKNRKAHDVRHRQHCIDMVGRRRATQHDRRPRREQHTPMAEHHAFRLTGGAGGVHQRGHLTSRVRCDRFRLRRFVQRTDTNPSERPNLALFGLQTDERDRPLPWRLQWS